MSNHTPLPNESLSASILPTKPSLAALRSVVGSLRRSVQVLSFWIAIVLPLAYLPLLTRGLDASVTVAFVALLVVNVAALYAGHGYKQP